MNRNVLKIIALISMIIDHIGLVFFPGQVVFRILGRVSFPIFAFFIAEGYFYTRNKKRYVGLLGLFCVISWFPFCIALDFPLYSFNMLGEFIISILGMFLIDKIRLSDDKKVMYICILAFMLFACFVLEAFVIFPTGVLGISLPIVFYAFRNHKPIWFTSAFFILLLMSITIVISEPFGLYSCRQFFSLVALIPLMCYNGNVGKVNLKYLFYTVYPLHLIVLALIKLLVL